ncbi:MAG TPA: hypothetical protein VN864_05620 [Thermoplasmata archaeon]|nr:hypothetical protein [Thermoplasmata archaeon]
MSGPYSSAGSLPLGVAILAVLIGIFGFLFLVAGILILAVSVVGYTIPGFAVFGAGLLGGALLTIFAIVLLAVAFGLWNQELWALVLSIIVIGLFLVSDIVQGAFFTLSGIILVLLLVYLIAVHRHFI